MPDLKIHVDIWHLADPADFQPNGITIVPHFLGNVVEARTYWHNGSSPVEDLPDTWQPQSVRVHQTVVPYGSVDYPVTLESGKNTKVKFVVTEYPTGSGNATLWILVDSV